MRHISKSAFGPNDRRTVFGSIRHHEITYFVTMDVDDGGHPQPQVSTSTIFNINGANDINGANGLTFMNGYQSPPPPPTQDELERELPVVYDGQVPLGDLLSRVVQGIYAELSELAET